jgi:hypothetical protein
MAARSPSSGGWRPSWKTGAAWLLFAAVVAAAVVTARLFLASPGVAADAPEGRPAARADLEPDVMPKPSAAHDPDVGNVVENADGEDSRVEEDQAAEAATQEEPLSEEERLEREEEALVEAFDALTDKWMEPSAAGVTMNDVENFAAQFKKVPRPRREECLQRALNLVPDENVMLLAGILMDKSQDPELVQTVYNDVLNRDEDAKKPILREIFRDKSHPCWADTAWILDVTGELPSAEKRVD